MLEVAQLSASDFSTSYFTALGVWLSVEYVYHVCFYFSRLLLFVINRGSLL